MVVIFGNLLNYMNKSVSGSCLDQIELIGSLHK